MFKQMTTSASTPMSPIHFHDERPTSGDGSSPGSELTFNTVKACLHIVRELMNPKT